MIFDQFQSYVGNHPMWHWIVILISLALSWLAPIAALVTIFCALLQAYIAWKKYQHWKSRREDD